ncbi:YwqG family protein [Pendulispora albinea]|uniref:DUF1963 domain-containing protein n=1 Tax=Pendulispora albinea TaxID=2741071 RepID=A0ABZ2M6V9_9BACT
MSNAHVLATFAERALRIAATPADLATLPIGASRFGGAPDVPAIFVWPTCAGRPLTFLAQLDLSEVNAPGLPPRGFLLFFYDVIELPFDVAPGDPAASVLFLDVDRSTLVRRAHPPIDPEGGPFAGCRLAFRPVVDLPTIGDAVLEAAGIALDEREYEAYEKVAVSLSEVETPNRYHHLLGYPQTMQSEMRTALQSAANGISSEDARARRDALLRDAVAEWQLLLQIDTDDDEEDGPGWMWGGCGRLYFWIRTSDLEARAFDQVWVILQCT